ncbi:MAG TPA: ABC transporter substrate-binding protein [Candidatus Desulfovibrio gallistercoris]|nr:ABC transporter substrate-binding protein [Candidatus Desulfovibrio gallistercoris]
MKTLFILLLLAFIPHPASASSSRADELVVGIESAPQHCNPAVLSGSITTSIGAQLFAGLTRLDAEGRPRPYLARSWESSPDGLRMTFHLEPGAVFHDGSPITAGDVAFSLLQCRDHHPFRPMLAPVAGVDTPDPHTAVVRLRHPFPLLPAVLLPSLVPIMPRHVYGDGTPLPDHPANIRVVGSGPYMLTSFQEDRAVRMVRNPRFFLPERPAFERLTFRVFRDPAEVLHAMRLGSVDMYLCPAPVEGGLLVRTGMDWHPRIQPVRHIHAYTLLNYNLSREPFSHPQVREALSLAIDRKRLIRRFPHGSIQALQGPFPPDAPFAVDCTQAYDPARANALLDAAGYPRGTDGKRFVLRLNYSPDISPGLQDLIKYLQHEFAVRLGIVLETRDVESVSRWRQILSEGDFDVALDEVFFWQDPVVGFHRLYSGGNRQRRLIWTNMTGYVEPLVEELMEQAGQTTDKHVRQELYARIQERIARDNPALWLMTNPYVIIASPRIGGLESLVQGTMSPLDTVFPLPHREGE